MFAAFMKNEEGAQVVEYSLIIAVISISLVIAFDALTVGGSFSNFIDRVSTCLTTANCL